MPESNAPRFRRVFLAAAAGAAAATAVSAIDPRSAARARVDGDVVEAVRPNVPSFGRLHIYLNKAVSASTAVAWTVLG